MKDSAVPLCRQFINEHLADAYDLLSEEELDDVDRPSKKNKPPERMEPIPCTNFEDLMGTVRKRLFITPSMVTTLAVCLATNISVKLGRPFVWVYVKGPPSTGKSTYCEMLSADTYHSEPVDIFTGLHSGYRTKGKKARDVSLLKMIDGKNWVTKDWTATLTQPEPIVRKLYGQLRDAYDGSTKTKYGNDVAFSYKNINFSMTVGVTEEILRQANTHLGERFLLCDMTDDEHGSYKHVRMAFDSFMGVLNSSFPQKKEATDNREKFIPPNADEEMQRKTIGFLDYLHDKIQTCSPPTISDEHAVRIVQMSRFIARIRGHVARGDNGREILYRPKPEVAIRLTTQLGKLAQCLCIVFGKTAIDHEILDIVAKVAIDTAQGFNLDIVNILMEGHEAGKLGMSKGMLAKKLDLLKETAIDRRLQDMKHLKIVRNVKVPNNSGASGRHSHLWEVLPPVRHLWKHLVGQYRKDHPKQRNR